MGFFLLNEINTVCAFVLKSLSNCLEVNSEIDFFSYPGKSFILSTATCFIFRHINTSTLFFPSWHWPVPQELLRAFSNLQPIAAPICPYHCNHSGLLLRALTQHMVTENSFLPSSYHDTALSACCTRSAGSFTMECAVWPASILRLMPLVNYPFCGTCLRI